MGLELSSSPRIRDSLTRCHRREVRAKREKPVVCSLVHTRPTSHFVGGYVTRVQPALPRSLRSASVIVLQQLTRSRNGNWMFPEIPGEASPGGI